VVDIKSQTAEEFAGSISDWVNRIYRVAQLLEWLYVHRVGEWEAICRFSQSLCGTSSARTTACILWSLYASKAHGTLRRSSYGGLATIPSSKAFSSPPVQHSNGEPSDRHTLCVRPRSGCAYGANSAPAVLPDGKRNLGVEEIVDQVVAVERWNSTPSPSQDRTSNASSTAKTDA